MWSDNYALIFLLFCAGVAVVCAATAVICLIADHVHNARRRKALRAYYAGLTRKFEYEEN